MLVPVASGRTERQWSGVTMRQARPRIKISLMAVQERILPSTIKPMLGRLARDPFDSPKHIFELKWDGMRALAFTEGGELRLYIRNVLNISTQLPESAEMPSQVKCGPVSLDGEIVCLEEDNRPSFPRR